MNKRNVRLLFWILGFQMVGFLIGRLTAWNIATWYPLLKQPPFNPPVIAFPIAWSILYVMIATAGWQLWENRLDQRARLAFTFYGIQVIMNWLWTPIFFQLHLIQLGFYWILVMIVLNLLTILITNKYYKLTTAMLTPYVCWLMFAAYLNGWIWLHN